MKRILTLQALLAFIPAFAWNVGTEPTVKSALIEDFTGIQCSNCPDGHSVAAMLSALHPDEVFMIGIHSGYFASPSIREPDFRTDLGDAIHDYFGINSYPSAVVSRVNSGKGMVQGRSSWGTSCGAVTAESSPVNLWTAATYDPETRLLTVDVEGYLNDGMTDPRLNIFLLQNEILGPQKGGLLGVEYPHRHILRDRLTDDDFGDPVGVHEAGEYFSRHVEFTLPDEIKSIPTDPVNMELITFVTDGVENVCKVSLARPDTSSLPQTFSVSCVAAPIPVGKNYAFDFLEVMLYNHGGEAVTTADFAVTINGEKSTRTWTGELAPHSAMLARVPLEGSLKYTYEEEATTYAIRLISANGIEVESATISGKIQEIASYPSRFTIKIKTDLDAADNAYRILDESGEVIYDFGPYAAGEIGEYSEQVELEDDKVYCLEIFDCWGDGICHPLGNVKLFDEGGKQIAQYKEITGYGMRQFFRTEASAGLTAPVASATEVSVEYFDVTGRRVTTMSDGGIYIVRTKYSDGTVLSEKYLK